MTATDIEKTSAAKSTSPQAKSTSPQGKQQEASPDKSASNVDKKKEAMSLFVAGKRHLLVKEVDSAVDKFALACEMLSAEYGEAAYECADAYYYYGKALLEMARTEAGVFGNALDGVPDGDDCDNSQVEDPDKMTEEEREDVEKKVGEALDENYVVLQEKEESRQKRAESTEEEETEESEEKPSSEKESAETKPEAEKKETEAEKSKEAEKSSEEPEAEKTKEAGDAKDEEEPKDGEEDPSNLQLAWEMLEIAKVAYTNKLPSASADEKKGIEMKICETLLALGEVSVENETYEQAVTDITECLNKRKELHAADSRRIAETYYNLGVALGHFDKFEEALAALQDSIKVLNLRMENLKNKCESSDEAKGEDAFYSREAEITELESLIPEIEEKIQDTKDMKEEADKAGKTENGTTGFDKKPEEDAKPVSSIAVKRKADAAEAGSPKKANIA